MVKQSRIPKETTKIGFFIYPSLILMRQTYDPGQPMSSQMRIVKLCR